MLNKSTLLAFWRIVHNDCHHLQYGLLSFLTLIISALPIWASTGIHLQFYLFVLYFGTLYYPPMLSLWLIFFTGLIQDGIYGYPLGLSSLKFLSLHSILLTQVKYFTEGGITLSWIGFGVFCLIDSFFQSLLLSYIFGQYPAYMTFLPGTVVTICAYPLSFKLLYGLSRKIG